MAYRSLPKFNPEARFVVNRAFTYNGQLLRPGEAVQGIPERRLRQLYEKRTVVVAPAPAAHAARKGKR